jgi:hypothetical protein
MDFFTKVNIAETEYKISYKDRTMFIGSCFAGNVGAKMDEACFNTIINPFGVLYNPLSVANACKRLLSPVPYNNEDLFRYNNLFHSFDHHGSFSAESADTCVASINNSLFTSSDFFKNMDHLILTFGTSYVYCLTDSNHVVANCHKLPDSRFHRKKLSADNIINVWAELIKELLNANPSLKITFTVSPVRHLKDGAHGNQISKSTLLIAVNSLVESFPCASYFPAYEIMLDELRDYRFYDEDMIHPSVQAINYIWNRFCSTCMSNETLNDMKDVESLVKAINHRPLHADNEAYKHFLGQTLLKINLLKKNKPYICIEKKEKSLLNKYNIQNELQNNGNSRDC